MQHCPESWCLYVEISSTGNAFVHLPVSLTRAAGGEKRQRPAGVYQRGWAWKQGPQAPGWPWPVQWSLPARRPGRRTRCAAAQGVVRAVWSAGSRDRAELRRCSLQPTRCSGRRRDAVVPQHFQENRDQTFPSLLGQYSDIKIISNCYVILSKNDVLLVVPVILVHSQLLNKIIIGSIS